MNSSATSSESLLVATGQARKLHAAGLLFFGGLAITALRHLPAVAIEPITIIVIASFGCLVMIGGALVALYSIRCPSCSLRWTWWSLRTQPFTRWLFWLQEFNTCPKCSLSASDGNVRQPNKSLERTRAR
jgi:hypothetical protein